MPHVPEVLECSLLGLSSDDDSITNTVFLKSNSNGGIVIVSPPIDLENEGTHPCNVNSLHGNESSVIDTPLRDLGSFEVPFTTELIKTPINSTLQSSRSDRDQNASKLKMLEMCLARHFNVSHSHRMMRHLRWRRKVSMRL